MKISERKIIQIFIIFAIFYIIKRITETQEKNIKMTFPRFGKKKFKEFTFFFSS